VIRRFCLYGFLKNQQYYEPFILLAFIQMGLSYTIIGFLIAFREFLVNLMEIPSGAVADVWGRRKSMIVSFIAYIIHFLMIGLAGAAAVNGRIPFSLLVGFLFLSMFFFSVGEAFRTGTHKAMIFTWLRIQGKSDQKTAVYGYTRSWSKTGSAVSVLLACVFVYFTKSYIYVFFFSIIPYLLNIINFAGYPAELDGEGTGSLSFRGILHHIKDSFSAIFRKKSLRRLIMESMGYEGLFKSVKDYLQPILKQSALPLITLMFAHVSLDQEQQSVILIGPVYFILFVLSASASKRSHKLVGRIGTEENTARFLWFCMLVLMGVLLPSMFFSIPWLMITGFVVYHVLQNLWRPVLISRFDAHSFEAQGATVMSIESQSKSIATALIAPLMGGAVDFVKSRNIGRSEFWPVAAAGALIALFFLLSSGRISAEEIMDAEP